MLSSTSRPVLRLLRMTLLKANDGYAFSVMWRRWRSSLSMWDDARVAVSACATVRALRVCGAAAEILGLAVLPTAVLSDAGAAAVASCVALLAFSAVSAFAVSVCASASACAACSSALSAASPVSSASSAVAVSAVSRSASSAVSSITTLNCTDSVDSSSCSIWSALVGSLFSLTWIPPWSAWSPGSARLVSSARFRRLPCLPHLWRCRRFRHC